MYKKKIGLRKLIYEELKNRRFMTFNEAEQFAKDNGYRVSNLERRLRPSESEQVIAIKSQTPPYAIMAYRYMGNEEPTIEFQRQNNLF